VTVGPSCPQVARSLLNPLLNSANTDTGNILWAAHAGDSRAVMSRNGAALGLTQDHKPDIKFEKARVEENGGRVEFQRWVLDELALCPVHAPLELRKRVLSSSKLS